MNNRRMTQGFRSLIAWQEAKTLTLKIYRCTKKFPKEELFGITSQLRRAANSVAANLAEGSAMPTSANRRAFYNRARASGVEVDNFAEISFELEYLTPEEFDDLSDHCARIVHLIGALSKTT